MAEEGSPPADAPKAPDVVSVEDFNRLRAALDGQVATLAKQLSSVTKERDEALAEAKLATEVASPDATKSLERERAIRKRELVVQEAEARQAGVQHTLDVAEVLAEAKSRNIEVTPELQVELGKQPDKGSMALVVLRKLGESKPASRVPIPSTPGTSKTLRYGNENTAEGLAEFLRQEGRIR